MITKDMIRDGIRKGSIMLVTDPNMDSGTVCKIGGYWFYFGGETAEQMEPLDYLHAVPMEDVIDEIFLALDAFRQSEHSRDEYDYYEAYLNEQIAMKMDTLQERDAELERLWNELEDVPMNPETEEIETAFLHFPAGTNREKIWEWFDERYSRGVAKLMHVGEVKDREVARALYLQDLCTECDSEYCVFNPDGICKVPFVTGEAPRLGDDGCADYCYKEVE